MPDGAGKGVAGRGSGIGIGTGIGTGVGKSVGMFQELHIGRMIPVVGPFGNVVGSTAGENQSMELESRTLHAGPMTLNLVLKAMGSSCEVWGSHSVF